VPFGSAPTALGVYAGSPDLNVTAASATLDVSYENPSKPLAVTIGSVAGLAGDVQLSCTGLPVGMSCKFDSTTPALAADGSVTTNVVIGPSVTEATFGLFLLLLLVIGWRRDERKLQRRAMAGFLGLCIAGASLTGCHADNSGIPHETGTKTVLINATVGSVSRSVAVDVNIG
jgi:hypothetical protein